VTSQSFGTGWKATVVTAGAGTKILNLPAYASSIYVSCGSSALVWVLIHSRLDYCNALFAGFPVSQLVRLQSALKVAACLVLGLPGCAPSYYTDAQLITLAQLSTPSDRQTILAHVQVCARTSTSIPYQTLCTAFLCLGTVSTPTG